ncbi:hypothetical protein NMG60_11006534 [Bertholletia excelsa]
MSSKGRALKTSLGAVLAMGFIWFLFVGVLSSRMTETTAIRSQSTTKPELLKLIGNKQFGHWDLDPNYASKRRVPNGPDPIHNRRAGKARVPPSRV